MTPPGFDAVMVQRAPGFGATLLRYRANVIADKIRVARE
jgi:hypothetical protein